jgi:hypothetical protein
MGRVGEGGRTVAAGLVDDGLFAFEYEVEVLAEGDDLLLGVDDLGGFDVDDVADGPDVGCVLDAEVLVDDGVALLVEEVVGDVLAVGQHADGGDVQVHDLGLAVAEGELGLALGGRLGVGDLDALDDLDVHRAEHLLGAFGDADGEAVGAELSSGRDQGDLLGLPVFEAEFSSGFNARWSCPTQHDGLGRLNPGLMLVKDVLGGLVTSKGGLPRRLGDGPGARGEDQDIVVLLRLARSGCDGHLFGFGVELGRSAEDEFKGAFWVLLKTRLDFSKDLAGVSRLTCAVKWSVSPSLPSHR